MSPAHHLPEGLLLAYATGRLPEGFALVVATHLSLCPSCRAAAESFDHLGGALLDAAAPEEADEAEALARCWAKIEARPVQTRPAPRAKTPGALPAPLAAYLPQGLDGARWQNLGGGLRQALLPTGRDARARLLRIPAGRAVPEHGHAGLEMTLVLRGAFRDGDQRFGPGDVEIEWGGADPGPGHQPVAEPGEDCLCLAATEAPLRFRALLPRLLQPIFRI